MLQERRQTVDDEWAIFPEPLTQFALLEDKTLVKGSENYTLPGGHEIGKIRVDQSFSSLLNALHLK